MKQPARMLIGLVAVTGLACTLSGCTIKATLKTVTDGVVNVLSSTSGKSWLTEDGLVKSEEKVNVFAAMTFDNLKQDMAKGEGEYLTSLGTLLGITHDQQDEFSTLAKDRYDILVPSEATTPGEMVAALSRELSANPRLQ